MEPPGSPSWMSSPPDQPLPNSPPLAPLAISGPQQRLGRRIGGGLGAGTRCRRPCAEISAATAADTSSSAAASTRVLWRFGGKLLIRDAGGWFPCGGLGRVVAHSGPGGVAAGRARTLRPGRAMSGAGKLDGARHARCKNPMDRTECRARPRRLPSRCLPSHPRYPQRLGLPGAGRVAMVVSKVCSIRCGGACLHRRRSLILMSGLNAMLRGPRGCRRRSSIGSARRLGPKTGPLRRSWWRWGSCSPIGGRVAGAARSG
ncbi:Uncharacterised protein [Mycobacterium tuberculosis]|nr:Uncharacterised protein [Mycobacterium tuberculosis]